MKFKNILLITIFFLFILSCNKLKENEELQKEQINVDQKDLIKLSLLAVKESNIEIAEAAESKLNGEINAPAKIVPNQDNEAQVGSLVSGRVTKAFVNVGDYVKKGQTLMLIESLQIGEINAQFMQAKANLINAEGNFKRQKTLIEQNIGSQKTYLEVQTEYEKAKAEFNAADKRIHSIGIEHNDQTLISDSGHTAGILPIKAPINGIITERNIVIGQLIESQTIAFRIINTANLWAEGQIYEKDITKVSGKPRVEFRSISYPKEKFAGNILTISQTIDEHSRTLNVRASLQNPDNRLKPNMFGELIIPISNDIRGIIISTDALIKEGDKFYAFLAVNDTTFKKQYVKIGVEFNGKVEIVNGLQKGDMIVTQGVFFLKSELMKETFGEDE